MVDEREIEVGRAWSGRLTAAVVSKSGDDRLNTERYVEIFDEGRVGGAEEGTVAKRAVEKAVEVDVGA